MAVGNLLIENYDPYVKDNKGIKTNLPITMSGTSANLAVGGTLTVTGTQTNTGTVTNNGNEVTTGSSTVTGGIIGPGTFSTVFHSGNVGPVATTGLTQTQIVTTDTYFCEVWIPANTTLTGVSILNGHTTSASQNMFVGLANSAGTIVANSNTTTAQSTADAYQKIPFTATYSAVGPAKYYIAVQGSATTGFIATHTIGNFGATLITSETYGTFLTTASYSTTTFTTARGPVADVY